MKLCRFLLITLVVACSWLVAPQTAVVRALQPVPPPPYTPPPLERAPGVEVLNSFGGALYAIAASGTYAYVGAGKALEIIDVSNPNAPARTGRIALPSFIAGLDVVGTTVYVAAVTDGLYIVDASNPAAPVLRSAFTSFNGVPNSFRLIVSAVQVVGTTAYVGTSDGLYQIDVSDPNAPNTLAFYPVPASEFFVADGLAYVTDYNNTVSIIDLGAGEQAPVLGRVRVAGYIQKLQLVGNRLYVAARSYGGNGVLAILDVGNPRAPALLSALTTVPINDVQVANNIVYLATGAYPDDAASIDGIVGYSPQNTLTTVDVSNPADPRVIGAYTTPFTARAVAVAAEQLYVVSGGLLVLDAQNPQQLQPRGMLPLPNSSARDIVVEGNLTYVLMPYSLQIIDTSDAAAPTLLSSYPLRFPAQFVLQNGFVYLATYFEGLKIIDVHDPRAPQQVNTAPQIEYSGALRVQGNIAYVSTQYALVDTTPDRAEIALLDISDPVTPTLRSAVPFSGTIQALDLSGTTLFVVNQPSDAPDFFYNTLTQLTLIDVQNAQDPTIIGSYPITDTVTSMLVHDQTVYLSGYDGIRVLDVSNLHEPVLRTTLRGPQNELRGAPLYAVDGNLLYAGSSDTLHVVNLAATTPFGAVASFRTGGDASAVAVRDSVVSIANGWAGVQVVRFSPDLLFTKPLFLPLVSTTFER